MPSANPKLEKQASTEAVEPIRLAITVIEHKIRNLEKRKGKLESYKDLQKQGKELNHDQKIAVAKYDEVVQTLDLTRELCKQVVGIANDAAKQQKKLARKEAVERTQQDVAKVREVLLVQDCLTQMGSDKAREDFLAGKNGAVKLTEEDLKHLDDLYVEVTVKHASEEEELPFIQQAQKAAEHFVAIVDGKQREFVGTTYNRLKEIVASIVQSGYFDRAETPVVLVEEVSEAATEALTAEVPTQDQITEEYSGSERHIPPPESMIPIPSFPVPSAAPIPVISGAAPVSGPIPVVAQPIPAHAPAQVEASYYSNAPAGFVPPPQQPQQVQAPRINDVIGTPNFFFLQESELDSPDVAAAAQAPIVSHIPPAVNAPIPSQTFTNQNFGAPQNVVAQQQVIYQHPPQDMPHIPGFANPNPPPPIPMPPSHQQSIQYSPQHPAGFQQQQTPQTQQPQQMIQQNQSYEQAVQLESQSQVNNEDNVDQGQDEPSGEGDLDPVDDGGDWCQSTETAGDWSQQENSPPQQHQQQPSQQAWGDQQRGGYRGRGGRRGNTNGYNGRGRGGGGGGGAGGYQQNGRSGGQGTYYRNNDSNYQNGYQQRSYNAEGNGGYNGGFKSRGGGGQRGGPRAERGGMDRGGRGQFRGQRGGGGGGGSRGYAPRGKAQAQQ